MEPERSLQKVHDSARCTAGPIACSKGRSTSPYTSTYTSPYLCRASVESQAPCLSATYRGPQVHQRLQRSAERACGVRGGGGAGGARAPTVGSAPSAEGVRGSRRSRRGSALLEKNARAVRHRSSSLCGSTHAVNSVAQGAPHTHACVGRRRVHDVSDHHCRLPGGSSSIVRDGKEQAAAT